MDGGGIPQQLVVFEIAGRLYGLPIEAVDEVVRMVALTPVLDAPPWVAGLVDLRGRVVPVIDLRPRLGQPAAGADPALVILVASTARLTLGLIADRVTDVADRVGPADEASGALASRHGFVATATRCACGVVLLLDLDRLAADSGGSAAAKLDPALA